jgi:opacity protein-like surface antigen
MNDPRLLVAAALLLAGSPAKAAPPAKGTPQPPGESSFTLSLEAGYFHINASDSAHAVLGSAGGFMLGGDVRYVFARHFFAGAGVRHFGKDGERVFVADAGGPVFPLGLPLHLSLTPVDFVVGYRFGGGKPGRNKGQGLVPYFGAGLELARYHETSDIAGLTEESNETKAGVQFLAGLEHHRRPLVFALEAAYSIVPNAIGVGGVSQIFDEKDIGGFRVMGRVGYRFARK